MRLTKRSPPHKRPDNHCDGLRRTRGFCHSAASDVHIFQSSLGQNIRETACHNDGDIGHPLHLACDFIIDLPPTNHSLTGMRIIGGTLKRRLLKGPKSARIRPALDRVKEAIFNILGNVAELNILDLFAGTGSLGMEALSRGAHHATFVDDSKEAIGIMHANLEALKLTDRSEVIFKSATAALRQLALAKRQFDLIFVDPPYDQDLIDSALDVIALLHLLSDTGWIVVEHSPREHPSSPGLQLSDVRSYGQTRVSFFTTKKEPV